MPEELKEDLTPHYVPEQFAKYNIKSSFFSNYWKSMISIGFAMAGGLFFLGLEKIVKKRSGQNDTHNILMRFRMIFLWNLVLLVFCSSLSLMIIFTSLEVRDLDINTVGDGFSFAICIIANLVASIKRRRAFGGLRAVDVGLRDASYPARLRPILAISTTIGY